MLKYKMQYMNTNRPNSIMMGLLILFFSLSSLVLLPYGTGIDSNKMGAHDEHSETFYMSKPVPFLTKEGKEIRVSFKLYVCVFYPIIVPSNSCMIFTMLHVSV